MSVIAAVEALPASGITVSALNALDSIVPGEWSNTRDFDAIIGEVLGDAATPALVGVVRSKAIAIEAADPQRYARALQIYSAVDKVDQVAAGAAAVSAVSGLFGGLGFLEQFTPKPETTQSVDAGLKLIAELLAFGQLNGMPTTDAEGLARFINALADYARYDLMRIAAWVVFDGVLPLGPHFVKTIVGTWKGLATDTISDNPVFAQLSDRLPGDTVAEKRGFVVQALESTGEWVGKFVEEKGLTQQGVLQKLDGVLSVTAGGMDVVAAAIDASTDYTRHTGTQTVARTLARHAVDALREDVWNDYVASLA